jgi:P-type Ca2+ transporter type 2C
VQPHRLSPEETLKSLDTTGAGLSAENARARLDRFGPNELREKARKTPLMMFLGQFSDFMILVLIAAAIVSGVIGEPSDTIAIIVILLLNAVLGFIQEYRAEKAMAALKKMAAANALVLRNGTHVTIPARELVPGDIVLVEAGNIVPADLRIIEAARLKAEEAALTGESLAIEKHTNALPVESLPLGDRKNMLYKGTFVTYGRGTGVVTATGMDTELGRIATLLQEQGEAKTPLQKRLAHFGKRISLAVLLICAIVFAGGLLRGEPAVNIFLVAVSLAVAAIPEALPAVVTISLALGARRMVKQNALVRKLPAVETLGSVTYICSDKTGTLTLNKMTVEEMWVDGKTIRNSELGIRNEKNSTHDDKIPQSAIHIPHSTFLTALALSNDARVDASGKVIGDPTETALLSAAGGLGFKKAELERSCPRVAELPFDSDRKLMTTFHEITTDVLGSLSPPVPASPRLPVVPARPRFLSFTKGAVEVLLDQSTAVLTTDGIKPLNRDEVTKESERIAADGLRVMAIAMRTWDSLPLDRSSENVETGLILLGLTGMMDPPREEAKQAVAECRSAGITAVMITGDHPLTARTIARRVGVLETDDPKAVITGAELDALSLAEFEQRVESIRVYARVAPEQKLKIVQALQDRGHFVAMTGDGVNDAPALKRADIGIAMGDTGTDVAKEASSMILLDDNFATIVKAVKEGRKIYDNVRKFIRYLLTTNSGEIWTLFLAPFLGLPIPLQPIHILWVNLVTDGLPALALSLEPAEQDVMSRPPRHPQEGLFAQGLGIHAIWAGLLMGGVVLGLQAWAIHIGDAHWQTMVFTVLCLLQLGHVMAIRSEKKSLFQQGVLSNKALFLTVVATIVLQLMTVYVPALNPVFKTQPLAANELIIVLVLSSVVFFAVELEKLMKRRQKTA